jgi:DNA mismatch repair protein MutL
VRSENGTIVPDYKPPGTLATLEQDAERLRAQLRQQFQQTIDRSTDAAGVELAAEVPADADTRLPQRIVPLAQIKNSYILAETEDGLLIIDQHAAHERILYEQMQAHAAQERLRSQLLVIPFTLQCSPREARAVEEHLATLNESGFQIEPFGRDTFLVRGIPLPIARQRYEQILRDLIDELVATATVQGLSRHRDDLLRLMSCKAAIKAGDALAPPEIDELLAQLRQAAMPFACNHGRPTMIRVTEEELERLFKRKG